MHKKLNYVVKTLFKALVKEIQIFSSFFYFIDCCSYL